MREPAFAVFYGSSMLMKAHCPECGSLSIVLKGKSACCDAVIVKPETYKQKREIEGESKRSHIPKSVKEKILIAQGNRCMYCGHRLDGAVYNSKRKKHVVLKAHFDHFICWKFSRDNTYDNLIGSCHVCNLIKSDLLFNNFADCQRYILRRRAIKGYDDSETPRAVVHESRKDFDFSPTPCVPMHNETHKGQNQQRENPNGVCLYCGRLTYIPENSRKPPINDHGDVVEYTIPACKARMKPRDFCNHLCKNAYNKENISHA